MLINEIPKSNVSFILFFYTLIGLCHSAEFNYGNYDSLEASDIGNNCSNLTIETRLIIAGFLFRAVG